MKILRLDLLAFGPFTDRSLELAAGDEGLHIVFGPNEAGKTSMLRALRQAFYGIPGNSTDNFIHPYPKLRIGATLGRRDGSQLELLRRKGNKNTLRTPDDKMPLDEALLRTFLGGVGEQQFKMMFGIDHASLIAGGQEIAHGGGEIGQTLFAAGAGIADLRTIGDDLQQQAAELFRPNGSKPEVNHTLSELKQARKKIRDAQLPSAAWAKHDTALREAQQRLTEIDTQLQAAEREKHRLTRIGEAIPIINRRRELQNRRDALGDVRRLPLDFSKKRSEARTTFALAAKAKKRADDAIAKDNEQLAKLQVSDTTNTLLGQAEAIKQVSEAVGKYLGGQSDRLSLAGERDSLRTDAKSRLQELRPDLTLEALEVGKSLRLTRLQRHAIRELGQEHGALALKEKQAHDTITELTQERDEARRQLEAMPEPLDNAALRDAVARAQKSGDCDDRLTDARVEQRLLTKEADVALAKLGLWSGRLDALERLPLPCPATIDRFETEHADAADRVERLEEKLQEVQEAKADKQCESALLQRDGNVPTHDALEAARHVRDLGWQRVLHAWKQETPSQENLLSQEDGATQDDLTPDNFWNHFDTSLSLEEAYGRAVARADAMADRLFQDASRVTQIQTIQDQIDTLRAEATSLVAQLAEAKDQQQQVTVAWNAAWQPAAIEPLPPREMHAWLRRHEDVIARAEAIRNQQTMIAKLEATIAAHCSKLKHQLAPLQPQEETATESSACPPTEATETPLAGLLAQCTAAIDTANNVANTRRQLAEKADKATRNLDTAKARAEEAASELATWHNEWATALEPLGLQSDTSPATVNDVVEQTNALFNTLKEADEKTQRIGQIDAAAEQFREKVADLVARVAPDLATLPADQAAAEMALRRERATLDCQKHEGLLTQKSDHEGQRDEAAATLDTMTARLDTMCREAACESPDDLPEAEQKSAEVIRLDEQLAARTQELAQLCTAGASVDALIAEAENVDADALPSQLDRLGEQISEYENEKARFSETVGSEKTHLAAMDASAAAADATIDAENLLAQLETGVRQYVGLRLASAVLQGAIERYREKNQDPVVTRASNLFQKLTLGAFTGLAIDYGDRYGDRDEALLIGTRPKKDALRPDQMSDGTADQLYLALRLASLETWLAHNEPIPFIVDDILIRFDDERAVATLHALAELSCRTQVIFFTHHAHLVTLARKQLDDKACFVHTLTRPGNGGSQSSGR